MSQRTVAVITDSVCGIDPRLAADFGVYLLPVRVLTPDGVFADGLDFGPDQAIDAINAGKKVETAEPHVAALAAAYTECANAGADAVVSVHVSGGLSKTVEAARSAAQTSPIPVTVVDTGTTGMAQSYAALAAGAVSLAGADATAVAHAATTVANGSQVYFTVDTLDFLRRSGRISGTVAALGSMLKLRPVMGMHEGQIDVLDRVRGTAQARKRVRGLAETAAASLTRPAAAVGLVGGDPVAQSLGVAINGPTLVSTPPTSLAIHAGPGMYYAAVAEMPAEYFDVLAASARG